MTRNADGERREPLPFGCRIGAGLQSTYSVNKYNSKTTPRANPADAADTAASGERRRWGRIVHDERGSASLEWSEVPADSERLALSIEDTGTEPRDVHRRRELTVLSIKSDDSFNPYDRVPERRSGPTRSKRDLRKLSEWMKMMRRLEEQKKKGGDR